jgi:hypothetical protein
MMNLAEEMKRRTEYKIRKSVKNSREIVIEEIQKTAESHKYNLEYLFPPFFSQQDKEDLFDYLYQEHFKVEFLDENKVLFISWDV